MIKNPRFNFLSLTALVLATVLVGVSPSFAVFSYQGCPDLAASDFRQVILVARSGSVSATTLAVDATLTEPVSMYVKPDGKVFWAERINIGNSGAQTGFGHVKMFDPSNNSVTQILNLPVAAGAAGQMGNAELGLRYFTLHPNFNENHWAYIYYMPRNTANGRGVDTMHVSRFDVNPTTYMVDVASEKRILSMPWTPGICCHQGGAMDWDNHGNLYITTGNNTENSTGFAPMVTTLLGSTGANKDRATQDNQARAANTMDWRGKLLRIHPDSSAAGYSIPAGNLRARFYELGGAWVAGQDTNKILPEIYSFGMRNSYSVNVDTITGWVMVGTVGNDQGTYSATMGPAGNDEFDINTKPQFNGWPYFVGRPKLTSAGVDSNAYNMINGAVGSSTYSLPRQSVDTVYNNSPNNSGVTHLIPATPCAMPESKQSGWYANTVYSALPTASEATTGPIYHYNSFPNNPKKWPPHLEGKWIVADAGRQQVFVATPNSTGTGVTDIQRIPGDGTAFTQQGTGIISMQMGPEGAMYITYYNSGFFTSSANTRITRVEYTGTCQPAVVSVNSAGSKKQESFARGVFYANMGGRLVWPTGMNTAQIFDLQGKKVWAGRRSTTEAFTELPTALKAGVLQVRFTP